jgi:hypothetical protein
LFKHAFLCLLLMGGTLASGCGRIALSGTDSSRARLKNVSQHSPPTDLTTADREGRVAAGVGANATLVFGMLGLFDADGNTVDGVSTSAFVRYALPGGTRPALRSVYLDFQDRPHRFEGAVKYSSGVGLELNFKDATLASSAEALPLALERMPSARTAIAMARRAGLSAAKYVVAYESHASGPELIVGEWVADDTGSDIEHVGTTRIFNALTGKLAGGASPAPVAPAIPEPDATAAPADDAATP